MKIRCISTLVLGALLSTATAWATSRCDLGAWGGEVPIPFTANSKVELADGEMYLLVGRIVYGPSLLGEKGNVPYLEIDLESHPWLANAKRVDAPFYPILQHGRQKAFHDGKLVRMTVIARGKIINQYNRPEYVIYLEPVTSSVRKRYP